MPEKTAILAMDTATGPCSVAIWKDGGVACLLTEAGPVMQSATLMPMVETALARCGLGYGDLTAIACTTGPGSFTGIRVGLAAARGICLATGLPGLGFTTLQVLAFGAAAESNGRPVLAALNAGKGEWYYQGFSGLQPLSAPAVGNVADALCFMAPPALLAGNSGAALAGFDIAGITYPRADALAGLAAGHAGSAQGITPFYIRAPDAKPMAVDR